MSCLVRGGRPVLALAMVLLLTSGCSVIARQVVKQAFTVVMRIGVEVLVTEGAQYVRHLLHKDDPAGGPTVTIVYAGTSRAEDRYAVSADGGIDISALEGQVTLAGSGHDRTVTVAPGTEVTIEITGDRAGDPPPPQTVSAPVTVAEPDTLQGRPRNADTRFDPGKKLTTDRLDTMPGVTGSFSAVYGTSSADSIYVGAATGSFTDPGRRAEEAIAILESGRVKGMKSVDPGPFGGAARCGSFTDYGIQFGVCAWADSYTIGELAFYSADTAEAAKALAGARAEIERRS